MARNGVVCLFFRQGGGWGRQHGMIHRPGGVAALPGLSFLSTPRFSRFPRRMPISRRPPWLAFVLSVLLHVVVLGWLALGTWRLADGPPAPSPPDELVMIEMPPPPVAPPPPATPAEPPPAPAAARPEPAPAPSVASSPNAANAPRAPLTQDAPPAPTAEEWAFAARYPLKNSKGYRYSWGQQVRSLMGTATEGPEQGVVRFRVEIAPNGTLARLDTLWATSAVAEQRARQAVASLPPLPPTPTGQPLVFEKTISFSPFTSDIPPIYKDDCLPDPPSFRNRFAWGGAGQPVRNDSLTDSPGDAPTEAGPAMPLEECLKLLPQDSMEAETANDQRQLRQWGSGQLAR